MNIDPKRPVVICRSAEPPEPIDPTFMQGFACRVCDKPVQVSHTGVKQIIDLNAQALCNACGGEYVKILSKLTKKGSIEHVELRINPEATAYIEDLTGESILDTFPTATTEILEDD